MKSAEELKALLDKIDHRGYPAYKELKGCYQFEQYVLSIDHVQGDPFAAPSKVSVHVTGKKAGFPAELYDAAYKRIMLQDELLRSFGKKISGYSFQAKGSGKSGLISVSRPGQEILERSAFYINPLNGDLILCMEVGFPANGRTINARELEKIFFSFLPQCVKETLFYRSLDAGMLKKNADLAEDQAYIRSYLKDHKMVAFVADGAILPRESGVSDRPMKDAVPFKSPKTFQVELLLPHYGKISGMGIPEGVTMIAGGGYHGKSTLLKALERGVYNHIAGDGREYVIVDDSALKIRAEDGRSIKKVDISMFIRNLPNRKNTVSFSTEDASGSTSQAANVVEGIEAETRLLLIDEDTSATNFMVRDELMQRVVNREKEPIIPFLDRVRELYQESGISTILVAGSSGSYFHKADMILQMDEYLPYDITEFAKKTAAEFPIPETAPPEYKKVLKQRIPLPDQKLRENNRVKIKTTGRDAVFIDREVIDLRYVEQLVDEEQVNTLGYLLKYSNDTLFDGKKSLTEAVTRAFFDMEKYGMRKIIGMDYFPVSMAMPRKQEIFACLNRWRRLNIKEGENK